LVPEEDGCDQEGAVNKTKETKQKKQKTKENTFFWIKNLNFL
jgi:hypothetical protein